MRITTIALTVLLGLAALTGCGGPDGAGDARPDCLAAAAATMTSTTYAFGSCDGNAMDSPCAAGQLLHRAFGGSVLRTPDELLAGGGLAPGDLEPGDVILALGPAGQPIAAVYAGQGGAWVLQPDTTRMERVAVAALDVTALFDIGRPLRDDAACVAAPPPVCPPVQPLGDDDDATTPAPRRPVPKNVPPIRACHTTQPPDDETAVRDVIECLFEAWVNRDIDQYMSAWASDAWYYDLGAQDAGTKKMPWLRARRAQNFKTLAPFDVALSGFTTKVGAGTAKVCSRYEFSRNGVVFDSSNEMYFLEEQGGIWFITENGENVGGCQ